MTLPFDKVNFTNGKLRLEAASLQGIYEGTLEDDDLTIKGQWQQQGQALSLVLKRIEQVHAEAGSQSDSDTTHSPPDTFQNSHNGGGSSLVTTMILVFVLVGVIGAIVLFVMKSSIRR